MAIPSGYGTEVLKKHFKAGLSDSDEKLIDGVADHIYTVLSISITETGTADEIVHMYIYQGATNDTTNKVELLRNKSLPSGSTFIYNERIVLVGTDELVIKTGTSANVDVWCSYIDQDWNDS